MATKTIFLVFLLPVAFSFAFGGIVLAEFLQESQRELNMMQFDSSEFGIMSEKSAEILGLKSQYSTSDPVSVQISVTDDDFDCGNLYITIYHSVTKEVITQTGFFDQCFAQSGAVLPVGDKFSELVDQPGDYEIMIDLSDESQNDSIIVKGKFSVK